MTNTNGKLRGLVEVLYRRTINGDITWEISSDKVSVFADLGIYRIEVSPEAGDTSFGNDMRITVFDDNGNQVDTFTDATFENAKPTYDGVNSYYTMMSSILEIAKRQATGADRAIQQLLDTLGGTAVTDPPKKKSAFDDLDDDVSF